jgi:hypothetical protein
MKASDKNVLLAKSWTQVAEKYDEQLAPLFKPWISQLISAFTAQSLPAGPALAPACGPGLQHSQESYSTSSIPTQILC